MSLWIERIIEAWLVALMVLTCLLGITRKRRPDYSHCLECDWTGPASEFPNHWQEAHSGHASLRRAC